MWAMLNDLSSNKPLEYDEFIKQQFEEAKKEEEARKGIMILLNFCMCCYLLNIFSY